MENESLLNMALVTHSNCLFYNKQVFCCCLSQYRKCDEILMFGNLIYAATVDEKKNSFLGFCNFKHTHIDSY